MPQYQYSGFDAKGKDIKGVVHADNAAAAKSLLRKDGLFPSTIKEVLISSDDGATPTNPVMALFKRIPIEDISNMTRQLATLVAAHIPLVEALAALVDQVENPQLKAAIARVRADVNEGSTFHNALSKFPDIFPDLYVSMVASGEASGALDIVLLRLADFLEYQARLRKKVMGAMLWSLCGLGDFYGGDSSAGRSLCREQTATPFDDPNRARPIKIYHCLLVGDAPWRCGFCDWGCTVSEDRSWKASVGRFKAKAPHLWRSF